MNCSESEIDDEIYRLLVYYQDRYAETGAEGGLTGFLVVGEGPLEERLQGISSEALGTVVRLLQPNDIGLYFPSGSLRFGDVAAPAAAASFGLR